MTDRERSFARDGKQKQLTAGGKNRKTASRDRTHTQRRSCLILMDKEIYIVNHKKWEEKTPSKQKPHHEMRKGEETPLKRESNIKI